MICDVLFDYCAWVYLCFGVCAVGCGVLTGLGLVLGVDCCIGIWVSSIYVVDIVACSFGIWFVVVCGCV